jgi:HK97 family phage major capsid protein
MSAIIEAKTAMRQLAAKAQEVVANADLTAAEKKTALDAIEADIKTHSDTIALHERAQRFIAGGEAADGSKSTDDGQEKAETRPWSQQVVESAAYKSLLDGKGKISRGDAMIDVKTAATIGEGVEGTFSGGAGQGGQLVLPQFLPGIVPLRFQPLKIADLMAQGTATSSAVTYVIESAFQDLTAVVAEGGAKPQLDLTLGRRQDNVTKIANWARVTDEMFEDAPAFQSYLQNRMMFGVQRVEEAEVLNGSGSGAHLQGILNRSGLATTVVTVAGLTAQKAVEGIFNQITALRSTSFVEPDAIVIHPTDWQTIRLGKDGQQQYYGGGPFTGAYGNPSPSNVAQLWGLPAVITTAIAQGTVLVGGFQECAQVFRRSGVRIEMTNSNVDDFTNNLVTIRAEERLALAVYRPSGFGKVTLTA